MPENIFNTRSRITSLDNMRALSIVMVVAAHSMGYCGEFHGSTNTIVNFIFHTINVPVFFLADGFLLARKRNTIDQVEFASYIKKSAMRLLLPWCIFIIGYSLLRYFLELNGLLAEKLIMGLPFTTILKNSYGSVIAPQLYFLLSLFIIRLALPLTRKLIRFSRFTMLVVFLGYMYLYYASIDYLEPFLLIANGQEPILHALWGFQFYLLGIVLYLFKDSIKTTYAFFICVSILGVTLIYKPNYLADPYLGRVVQYTYLLSYFFIFTIFQFNNHHIKQIGVNTMGIYLLHCPLVLKLASSLTGFFYFGPLFSFAGITIVTFAASFLLTIALRKIPYGSVLFGIPYTRPARLYDRLPARLVPEIA